MNQETSNQTESATAVDLHPLVRRFAIDIGVVDTDEMVTRWKEVVTYSNRADAERVAHMNRCELRIREILGWWNCQCHGRTETQCQCGSTTHFVITPNAGTHAPATKNL
jgi:hypothetical protein